MRTLACALLAAALAGMAPARALPPQGAAGDCYGGFHLIGGPGGADIDNAYLVISNGMIAGAGDLSRPPAGLSCRQDLAGKFVMPGLISAHAHVSDVNGAGPRAYTAENVQRQLGVYARYGITSVWSLGGEQAPAFEARDTQSTAALDRARIYLSGTIVTARTPEAAREQVAAVAATRPDIIKIRVDDNLGTTAKMPPETYRAVIGEAHTRQLRVAAHIFYLEDAKDLLRAGVDVIAHSVRDTDVDDEFIALMKARNVPYIPTLTREMVTFVYESTPAFFRDPFFLREADPAMIAQLGEPARQQSVRASASAQRYKAGLAVAERNVKKAVDSGLLVAMGTDSGAMAERFQGYFEHLELEMMVRAGLTPRQALRSATADAARAMGLDGQGGIGTLSPGRWADFVVLDRDPRADILNTRSISTVFMAGKAITR